MRSSIWRKPEPSNTHLKNKFFGKSEKQPFFSPTTIQPKLTIGAPNDKYEQEADAMADKVVSQPNSAVGNTQNGSPAIQTKCAGCAGEKEKGVQRMATEEEEGAVQRKEEEEAPAIQQMSEEEEGETVQKMGEEEEGDSVQRMGEEEQEGAVQRMEEEEESVQAKPLMRKTTNGGGVATSNLSTQLNSSKGNGHGLSKGTNQYMSQAFGRDFSQVRIHTDNRSVEMNKGIQAKAFTHGKDIYFNNGQYDPNSTKGKRLLAHELTHVVQQGGGEQQVQTSTLIQRKKGCSPCSGVTPSSCSAYIANKSWLPDAYVFNASCACKETPNDPKANCIRKVLQDRLAATPSSIKKIAAKMKRLYKFRLIGLATYNTFVVATLTPRIYLDHVIAYRTACCPSGPAPYPAWIGVSTVTMPNCASVWWSIKWGGGSCSGNIGQW